MTDEKRLIAKMEDALVNFYNTVGGPNAAAHERAGLQALNEGHLIEELKEAVKLDGAIIAHVTGHDTPVKTPAITPNSRSEVHKR